MASPDNNPSPTSQKHSTPTEINEILATVDGALGAAGHAMKDSVTRDATSRYLAGDITEAEALALIENS